VSKKFKGEICVYCVNNLSDTGDHIFAKAFFLPNRRKDLPQVPACNRCNSEKAKLENTLTSVLPFGGKHEDACFNLENVPKRLAQNARLDRLLAQGRKEVWTEEKSGLYVRRMILPIEPGSVEKLLEFVVKGLVWLHWKTYLTTECFVEVGAFLGGEEGLFRDSFSNASPDLTVSANLGNDTFLYEGFRDINSPQITAWRLSLYGGLDLACGPEGRRETFSSYSADTGFIGKMQGAGTLVKANG